MGLKTNTRRVLTMSMSKCYVCFLNRPIRKLVAYSLLQPV